jgi:hypothetical protein
VSVASADALPVAIAGVGSASARDVVVIHR